jgi:hypothetical protein
VDDSTKSKIQVSGLLVVCLITWYGSLLVRGRYSPMTATFGEHLGGATMAITAGAFTTIAFTKWIWKWSVLRPWLVDTPIVAGDWEGDVHRKYKNGQSNEAHVEVAVKIHQSTMSRVRFVQTMKDRSAEGHTEACELYRAADGKFYLEGVYQVTKNEEHKDTQGSERFIMERCGCNSTTH